MKDQEEHETKSSKAPLWGSLGSIGFLSLAGACGGACSAAALPLGTFLASIGFGSAAVYLPQLKVPLFLVSSLLAGFAIYKTIKTGSQARIAIVSCLLVGGLAYAGFQAFKPSECEKQFTISGMIARLSGPSQRIIKEGVYPLWLKLGRAPTLTEVKEELHLPSEDDVVSALRELDKVAWEDSFDEQSRTIKWMWPFSASNHGIVVQLEGAQPVFARCAVDALGMSAMFKKSAHISVTTPLDSKKVEFDVVDNKIRTDDPASVVSYGPGCDDIMFFSSEDEFEAFKKASHRTKLQFYTLQEAVNRGKLVFGSIYGS